MPILNSMTPRFNSNASRIKQQLKMQVILKPNTLIKHMFMHLSMVSLQLLDGDLVSIE